MNLFTFTLGRALSLNGQPAHFYSIANKPERIAFDATLTDIIGGALCSLAITSEQAENLWANSFTLPPQK